jgi:hypothetical protein
LKLLICEGFRLSIYKDELKFHLAAYSQHTFRSNAGQIARLQGELDAIAGDPAVSRVVIPGSGPVLFDPAVALSRNITPKRPFDMLVSGEFIYAGNALERGAAECRNQ